MSRLTAPKTSPILLSLVLVFVAAFARLLLQVLSMPPYAGLDESFHVARASFAARAGRSPAGDEPSVPAYILRSLRKDVRSPWSFAGLGPAWPDAIRGRRERWPDPRVTRDRGTAPTLANYQAQHPSLYYAIAGRALGLFPDRRQLAELMALRIASALFGSLAVVAAALVGGRLYGRSGVLAGALLGTAPTWIALVGRAGNDALAVAAFAGGLVLSTRSRATPLSIGAEAALWAIAVATKATTWPLLVVVAVSARTRRWPLPRLLAVGAAAGFSFVLTALDLWARTGSPLGDQGFAAGTAAVPATAGSAALPKMLRVLVASAIWPGAQHGNALTAFGMGLFVLPFLVLFLLARPGHGRRPRPRALIIASGSAFAAAQAVHAFGFVREAIRSGRPEPLGGFEGWYLWTLGPLLVPALLGWAFHRLRRARVLPFLFVVWLVAWDVRIHEGALYLDYAGETSPDSPSRLFRWGPSTSPEVGFDRLRFLGALGVPATGRASLRAVNVLCMLLLATWTLRRRGSSARTTAPLTSGPSCP